MSSSDDEPSRPSFHKGDSAINGVFDHSSTQENVVNTSTIFSKPMSFVKSSSSSEKPKASNAPAEEAWIQAVKRIPQSNAMFSEYMKEDKIENKKKNEPIKVLKKKGKVNVKSMGHWEKNTKGFGSRMLAKMNFQGRLGKSEDGVSTNMEVLIRPNKLGLGFGDFKEAVHLKANKKLEKERNGNEQHDEKEDNDDDKDGMIPEVEDEGYWRKRKKKKNTTKRVYQMQDDDVMKKSADKIVDKRGPVSKEWNSMTDWSKDTNRNVHVPKFGQEFIYNVQSVVAMLEGNVSENQHLHRIAASRHENLLAEIQEKEVEKVKVQRQCDRVSALQGTLAELEERSTTPGYPVDTYLDAVKDLAATYAEEVQACQLQDLIPQLVTPVLKRSLLEWEPLSQEDVQILHQLRQIQTMMCTSTSTKSLLFGGLDEVYDVRFEKLMENLLLPKVRTALMSTWKVREPHSAVSLLTVLSSLLPKTKMTTLLRQCVIPKLRMEVEKWNPIHDPQHVHTWLLPWDALCHDDIVTMYPHIRHVLGTALKKWTAEDSTALEVLRPWYTIWENTAWERMLQTNIVPKLITCIEDVVIITNETPSSASSTSMTYILDWVPYLSETSLLGLFAGHVYSKWITILHAKLFVGISDFRNLREWYLQWKKVLFPIQLLNNHGLFLRKMNFALYLMELSVLSRVIPPLAISLLQSYTDIVTAYTSKIPVKKGVPNELTFKNVVEAFAAERNIIFVPHFKRGQMHGNRLYSFGKKTIFLKEGVVFVENKDKNQFIPVALEDILQ